MHWRTIAETLRQAPWARGCIIHVSEVNTRRKTFAGVDVCGSRLAREIQAVARANPTLTDLVMIGDRMNGLALDPVTPVPPHDPPLSRAGHSLGGLICRFAAGLLFDRSTGLMAGCLRPRHYISLASPHLGCSSVEGEAQVRPLDPWCLRPGPALISATASWPTVER